MKKKMTAGIIAALLSLSLAACGGSGSSADAPAASGSSAPAAAGGETVDVGAFTVLVPDGWMGVVQTDVFGEKDEDGNYPPSTTSYGIIKGGESEWDAFSKPTIYAYYYENNAKSQGEGSLWFYDETKEISVTVNGTQCPSYEVKSDFSSDKDGSDVYVYDLVFVPFGDSACIQFNIPVSSSESEGVSVSDSDVMAILESAAVK